MGGLRQINTCRQVPLLVNFLEKLTLGFGVFVVIWSMLTSNNQSWSLTLFSRFALRRIRLVPNTDLNSHAKIIRQEIIENPDVAGCLKMHADLVWQATDRPHRKKNKTRFAAGNLNNKLYNTGEWTKQDLDAAYLKNKLCVRVESLSLIALASSPDPTK